MTSPAPSHALEPGARIPDFERTTDFGHWNRYAAVNDEFIPIHMDSEAGRAAGQPDAFGMGNLRIAYLHDLLRACLGEAGDIVRLECQFRGFNFKGDTLRAHGTVTSREEREGAELVQLSLGVENQDGFDITPATASVLLFGPTGARSLPEPTASPTFPERRASANIPQEVIDLIGETPPAIVSYPVGMNDIRRWAQAVYYPEPPPALFIDEAAAAASPWGGVVAPREFNPFAWMPAQSPGQYWEQLRAQRPTALNGGQEMSYYAPIRPGDVITRTRSFSDVYEKDGRSGNMVFTVGITRWTNQRDELVRLGRDTLILI
jgi:acyl dehydratase